MHDHIAQVMALYDEALEELMGAQKYARCMAKAGSEKDRAMYKELAHEEVKHALTLSKAGGSALNEVEHDHSIHEVWTHLKRHIHEWADDIERQTERSYN